ncbi:MAG: ATP-binding protein, partial [Eubacterium sp.]|nr:ATP-binding protein [Eubacterium sp.]
MMANKRAQEVFIPGALPESTYVTRKMKIGFTYEERLKQALSMDGYLTSISGPSKIGKTVLCEKVIGFERLVEVTGSDFNDEKNLWFQIGTKAGMPSAGEFTRGSDSNDAVSETYVITKDNVIDYYKQHGLVLLLDDFHYACPAMQMYMAQQFKDAIRRGFKVIIASLPHRSDDAIRTNPDLQGRISIIDLEAWTKDELKEIPIKGFSELSVNISEVNVDRLVEESICS